MATPLPPKSLNHSNSPSISDQAPDSGQLVKLTRAAQAIKQTDLAQLRKELAAAPDSAAARGAITTIQRTLQEFASKLLENPDYRTPPLVCPPEISNQAEVLDKKVYTYQELSDYLERECADIAIPPVILGAWINNKIAQTDWPWHVSRTATKRAEVLKQLPANRLDVFLEVNEAALRKLPAYGPNFTIDRSKITYQGKPAHLAKAFENGLVDNMIVEAYPDNVAQEDMRMHIAHWLLKIQSQTQNKISNHGEMSVFTKRMHQHIGAQIQFACTFKSDHKLRDYNLSIDDQLTQIGGYYPDWYYFNHYLLTTPVIKAGTYICLGVFTKGDVSKEVKYQVTISTYQDKIKLDYLISTNPILSEIGMFLI